MGKHFQNRSVLGALLAILVACPQAAWADGERQMAAIARASDGTIERLMTLSAPKSEDWLYKDYFAAPDDGIERSYTDTWRYHDRQSPYLSSGRLGEFYQIGGGTGLVQENAVRSNFADGVMRQRAETAFRSLLNPKNVPEEMRQRVQSVQEGLNKVKNTSVNLSKEPGSAQLSVGYNFISDSSKLELNAPRWGAGVYHTRLMGGLTTSSFSNGLILRVSAQPIAQLPTASLAYYPGASAVEGALSGQINPSVRASVSTVVSTDRNRPDSRYQLSFGFRL
ncbi:hypothetical protein K2X33_05005 [bacterium]|nr:hypothetical protein [bacterium]